MIIIRGIHPDPTRGTDFYGGIDAVYSVEIDEVYKGIWAPERVHSELSQSGKKIYWNPTEIVRNNG